VTEKASTFEFGPFRLDGRRRLLWRGDELLTVPPKAVDLLAALVEQPGQVVPKDELLRRVWPDTFVEEANLSVNVSILRKALGDGADGDCIQTVARRGYRFVGRVATGADAPRTLAVLPFRPLHGNEPDDALGLGLADALISRLASVGRIVVRPTATIRRFAAPDADPLEAGRALRVDAVLDARYRRAEGRLLVSAQLLPVDGSSPLWAERFDEAMTDVFAVEDAIAERLAAALVVELTADERRRFAHRHTQSVAAWQAYARGRYFWARLARPWLEKATASFEEAARLDPAYALPHAGLADVYLAAGLSGGVPPRLAWSLAARAAERARQRDPQLAEVHVTAGFLRLFEAWDWRGAEAAFLRAVELAPAAVVPHQWHGLLFGLLGRFAEGRRALERAAEIDPLSTIVSALQGLLFAFEGRHEEEVAQQRQTLELDPPHFLGHWALGAALANASSLDEAVAELRKAVDLSEGAPFLSAVLARALALCGRADEARAVLAGGGNVSPYQTATVHLALGERSRALAQLAAAADQRDPWVVALPVDPLLRPLRGDAAFEELVRRVQGGEPPR
jgi:DNA-binding winged helix-turn-helix (wHTH) protein/tetratricopeptide (TPR) repeat protein